MVAQADNSTPAAPAPALTGTGSCGPASTARKASWEADANLIQAAGSGNARAQRELLQRALPVARRAARCLLGRSQDVDDAVQATLLAVLDSAPRFQGRSSMSTWVTRIATRTTLRLAQKQRTLVPVEELNALATSDPEERRADEVPRRVWEYLTQLPQPQRVALVLRHSLEYSVDDIAKATETSPNTVKYRLKQALARIRRLVRQDLAVRGTHHER